MNDSHLVLITVFDGLRWDFVRPDWTPNLWALRAQGAWFARSHCVFPSVTRVNASSIATGSFPSGHGIGGNTIWRPDVDPTRPLRTNDRGDLLRLQSARGRLLTAPTLGEVLAAHGRRMVVVGTGSAGSTFLLHPLADSCDGAVLHNTFTAPETVAAAVERRVGPWPAEGSLPYPDLAVARVRHGFRALTEALVPDVRPALAAFWCTVPDGPHHHYGLGDPRSVASLQAADAAFGEALVRLQSLYEAVDIIVTADHGYISVSGHVDVPAELRAAGILPPADGPGTVVFADGGAVALHLGAEAEHEEVARYLIGQSWVAAILSPGGRIPGTLPLEATGGGGPDAPDLLCCLAWSDDVNAHGIPGSGLGGGGIAVGGGDHGGLSAWEMHQTLLCAGPSFRPDVICETPAGVVDIAPTTLRLLGLPAPAAWQGRALAEALDGGAESPLEPDEIVAVGAEVGGMMVEQRLTLAVKGAARYPFAARTIRT